MEAGKNIISNSKINTEGGDFVNGDNNFIQKIIINLENKEARLRSIIEQTKNVLNKIHSDISGIHLKRNLIDLPVTDLINENQFIFIDGEAGSGKSAYAKQILESLDDTCVISFAADQFLKSSLINTLHEISVDLSIQEIFSEFKEFSRQLIYIDSFEKLLEGDAEAFRELIAILRENNNIKLIISCRSYALEILKFNYFEKQLLQNNSTVVSVPQLTDEELHYFIENIPELDSIIHNVNLLEIIRIPKYLALSQKLVSIPNNDLSDIEIVGFKNKLWKNIVGGTNGLYEQKRQKTFIDIAVKRAKNLTLLTSANEFDSETVYALKADGILYEEDNLFAPSHDIFEDWGLIKYVNSLKVDNPKNHNFYRVLSNEPAIRRGFRLWVESKIEESESWIYNFVIQTINDNSIENHWKDEVLIAVVKSNLCEKFFNEYREELLEDKLRLLKKVIHLLKISGKDFNQSPNNKGWDVVIEFIYHNIELLPEINIQILGFLYDWENILHYGKIINSKTPEYAGKTVYKILESFDGEVNWMSSDDSDFLKEKGFKFLFQLAEYIPNEIKILLDSLFIKDKKGNYETSNLIKYALSHFHSGTLPKFFPDELIALANLNWRSKKAKSKSEFGFDSSLYGIEPYFGLKEKYDLNYFPQSAYQTFVFKLLKFHSRKAIDFIIDFTNYCTENYVNSGFLKDDGVTQSSDSVTTIDVLYNQTSYPIYGSPYLWSINRGGEIAVPDLLQSVVVALERFLYDLGKIESKKADEVIQSFFGRIYTTSNSVVLLSVLSSIAQAYPRKVGNKFLPLLSDKRFFEWESQRWIREFSAGALLEFPNASWEADLCDAERKEALKWEHRQKYHRGLNGFLIQYQLAYGNLNGELFKMFDYLETKHGKEDVYFLKLLSEIDGRKQKVEEVEHDGKRVIQIGPNYSLDDALEAEMKKNEEQVKLRDEYSAYSLWVSQTFLKKSEVDKTYEYWKECLEYAKNVDTSKLTFISSFPIGTLAALGLDSFSEKLSSEEFEFCVRTILEIAQKFYVRKKQERYDFENSDFSLSIYDNESVYCSLPRLFLFKNRLSVEQIEKIRVLLFLFVRDFHTELDIHLKHLYASFKKYVWNADYQFAYNCFIGLILYAEFNKKYPRHFQYSEQQLDEIQEEEQKILDFIKNNCDKYEFSDLSYLKYSPWDLDKVTRIFPIYEEYDFSYSFLKAIFHAHIDSYSLEDRKYGYPNNQKIGLTIKETITDFLFEINFNRNTKSLFEFIVDSGLNYETSKRQGRYAVEYFENFLEWFYYKADSNQGSEQMLDNFWSFWDTLFEKINLGFHLFNKEFLFYGNYWKSEAEDWGVLKYNNRADNYLKKLDKLDYINIKALIQLLSGIGFQSLNPQAIKILTKRLKSNTKPLSRIDILYGEKLVVRCFKYKLKEIKENDLLLDEFLWFLNLLIDHESSKAYYIRENLILYKKTNYAEK
ncbi:MULTISPECIES: ATP-binding protein [unclassified Flavobacterium]|uniref:ATP-binding protein n=1 Tax=unclassified Flavobacterium TaxID=196869 RepID=UPI001F13DCD6|nr:MULTISPECIES: ATP-binding protein [unclassified Flavobacterium]UMY64353.1 ATP-binding protein [Flavobacterium sp. HJ-32-4]